MIFDLDNKNTFCDWKINFNLEFQSPVASNQKGMQGKKLGPQFNKYKNLREKIYD